MNKQRDIHSNRLQKLDKIEKAHFINAKCRNSVAEKALSRTKESYNFKSEAKSNVLAGRIRDAKFDLERISKSSGNCSYGEVAQSELDKRMLKERIKV